MRKFVFRCIGYGIIVLIVLEILVRIFHLYRDTPERMIDPLGVEKWVPNQEGYSVTGNRRQNVGKYRINSSGFNSYREFEPTDDQFELALIGDSFIEGFHQDYNNSIGKNLEKKLGGIPVYEFGYAGYDLAAELHLIRAYNSIFSKIDRILIYLDYPDDLRRDSYRVSQERMRLESGAFKIMKQSKLLVYAQNIGLLGVLTNSVSRLSSWAVGILKSSKDAIPEKRTLEKDKEEIFLRNFRMLWERHAESKEKITFLIDGSEFPESIVEYFHSQEIPIIDYSEVFQQAEKPVTLIYDQHWNAFGRGLIADLISKEMASIERDSIHK